MQEFGSNIHSISSKKKWYFFLGTHHIGPFDEDQVINLYRQNKIAAETMTFCQGMSEWRPIHSLPHWRELLVFDVEEQERPLKRELKQDLKNSLGPDIAPLALERIASIPPAPRPPSSYFGAKELSSDFKLLKKAQVTKKKAPIEIAELEKEMISTPVLPPVPQVEEVATHPPVLQQIDKKGFSYLARIFFALLFSLLFVIPALFLFTGENKNDEENIKSLEQLSSALKSRLSLVAREDHLPFLKVGLAQGAKSTPNSVQIILALNHAGPYDLQATLSSVPKKIKSREKVVLSARGISGLHFASLNNWTLLEGQSFLPGLYALDLTLRPIGLKNSFLLWLKKSELFNFIPMVSRIEEVLKYRGLFWPGVGVGAHEEKKFEEEVDQYFSKELEGKTKPLQEKLEYWRTLYSMMEELRKVYVDALKEMKSGKDVVLYEKNYAKKVAMPLQSFIVSFDRQKIEEGKDQQILMAKEIGKLAADMSVLIQKKGKITPPVRTELSNVFDENWIVLYNATQAAIHQLEKEILQIQQEFTAE